MMWGAFGQPLWGQYVWVFWAMLLGMIFVDQTKCYRNTTGSTSSPSHPQHFGAARQMYGSASLRPPGSNPFVFVHRTQQESSPSPHGRRRPLPPLPPPPYYRYGYPVVILPNGKPVLISKSRNGLKQPYGGSYPHERYPVEYGRLPGKGFPQVDAPSRRYPPVKTKSGDQYLKMEDEGGYLPQCEECPKGEFLCVRSCDCIKPDDRCDGQVDCIGGEDELECGEAELNRNIKCEEADKKIRCPRSGRCISRDWVCDGDDDCGDFSDETKCSQPLTCGVDDFECANGLCIPKIWLCDNDNDCKDFSDEINCTKIGCTSDEFTCRDGSCIALSWKCDRQIDCADGSDENNCDTEPPVCSEGEFPCTYEKCIRIEFKCDGDNDCGDWSDEDDCTTFTGSCSIGQFKCSSGKCIPERFRCDKQQDCENNEDEVDCDVSVVRSCSPDEYTCKNGACILNKWVCDGVADCSQAEDEVNCDIECEESKFACSSGDVNDTRTEFCINRKHVCDGQKDCPKGEDEIGCPTNRTCEATSNCSQLCVTTADGKPGCSCRFGYRLAEDFITCEDVDECSYETDPVCSQTCTNNIGSFTCGCMTGYVLRPDQRSCKALGGHPTLLFANRVDIRQVSLSNAKYTSILKGLHNAIALDYHYKKGLIFWSDMSIDVIRCGFINGTGVKDVIKWGLESPAGVALDWIHDLVFWTDAGTRRIEVATLDGQERAVIHATELDKPRAISVHPGDALIFWTDWGPNPKIERSEMDGKNRRSIVNESVFWPNGLTLDYTTNRIYWADAKHNVIETAFFDGTDRKKVISKGLPHPFALTIFEDAIFWTDWHTKSISTANKATGAGLKTIHSNLHFPMDIHSYHPQRQPDYKNHCGPNNGGCEHMCLPNKKSYSCVCRMGQKLKLDRKTCQRPDKMMLFARKKDLRIKHFTRIGEHQHEVIVPVDGVKSAVALAWDARDDMIYWTDVEKDAISRAHWNGSSQEILFYHNIASPAGLALDWVTSKLYWTDAGTSKIEVANTNGTMRCLLIWEDLDKPRDILVDPIAGYMYWSDWGTHPKIERAAMDGKMRTILVSSNLTWPNGLAIDHLSEKIYWADGGTKAIEYANLDGTGRKLLIGGPDLPHPFGLDVFEDKVYWTDLESLNITSANKVTGASRTVIASGITGLMDVRIFHRNRKGARTPCNVSNGKCSHLCLLRPKGHSCACPTGIILEADGRTCANGPKNYLIIAHRIDIRHISLDVPYTADVVYPFPPLKKATSVDVDRKTEDIYWTDTAEDRIYRAKPDGSLLEPIIFNELDSADGLAIDSTGRKIYWTDGERNSIEVCELDGSNRKVLIWSQLDNPRAIALHYHLGLMFWSDWGANAKIEVAQMDGSHRMSIISKDLIWPNGLAVDRPAQRLYWNDGKMQTIESSDLWGRDRRLITREVGHPYGLVVVGGHIYWTDWESRGLHKAGKINGDNKTLIRGGLEGLMDVRSVQQDNIAENACGNNNGGCSHLCLRNKAGFSCACPTGLRFVNGSSKVCEDVPNRFLLVGTRYSLVRISFDTDEGWDVTLKVNGLSSAVHVDFHWEKKLVVYSDLDEMSVKVVGMKHYNDSKVVVKNVSAEDIAVDWIADNLYWIDAESKAIVVSKLDGKYSRILIQDNDTDPKSITVYPRRGYLFWTNWNTRKIERSYSDGSDRNSIINSDLTLPIALTIDYTSKRIYWVDAKKTYSIEHANFKGENRIQLHLQNIHPFSLTQYGDDVFWTEWPEKSVNQVEKLNAKNQKLVRSKLVGAMGLAMVTEERQMGWNPCAVNNGHCSHLCFFRQHSYVCGCPDEGDPSMECHTEPTSVVPLKCPIGLETCELDNEEDDTAFVPMEGTDDPLFPEEQETGLSKKFFLMTTIPMVCFTFFSIVVVVVIIIKKGKKKYLYPNGRSFSNPNYYSNDTSAPSSTVDKKQFIWKRLKYDKSQDRVYEERVGTGSPEVTSLIPAVLTPCSSNCEATTPELERSPSVTPLHKVDSIQIQPMA